MIPLGISNIKLMAKATESADDKLFSEAGSLRFEYMKWEKVGDKVSGILVGKYESVSQKYGGLQENYLLIKSDGSKVIVAGRNPRSKTDLTKIIYGAEKIPMGGNCGFIYTGEKVTTKGTAKLVEPKYLGDKDMDTYNKFKEMYNLEDVKAATEEPVAAESTEEPEPEL